MADAQDNPELDRLTDEFVGRLRRGELPGVEAFAAEHPDHEAQLLELLPVLVAMEAMKPAAPRQAPQHELPEYLGPYKVVRELGRGGMGRVFEALDAGGTRVAVKIVHPHLVDRPGYLARFLREVDTGGRIKHPGVIRTLGSGVADELGAEAPYLVLEFVEGQNLRELLNEVSPLSERLARVIGAHVARALDAIHAAGVVHRDVKPENVVITADETVKLMDLGVALIQEEGQRLSQTGEFVGSLLYSAPEQLRGRAIGPWTDLYALGLVLFELLTGRHAGAEDGQSKPVFAAAPRDDVSVRKHAPHVSPFMDALVLTLLQPASERRPASAHVVAEILAEGERSAWWLERSTGEHAAARPRADPGPLIGRDAQLARLAGLLAALGAGRGRTCVITGEAGIGKTHLLGAWLARVEERESHPPVLELDYAGIAGARVAASFAAALGSKLGTALESSVKRVLGDAEALGDAVIKHLQGVESVDALAADAAEKAYVLLLKDLALGRGLIVAVENLHLASADRLAAFLRIVRATAGAPILFVGTSRAPVDPTLGQELDRLEHAERLALGPLEEEDSLALLQAVARHASTSSGVRELVRRSGGNPYYLLELARELDRRSAQERARGSTSTIPESLGALIGERLASLEPAMIDLLGAAACCEHSFDPDVVVTAVELPRIAGLRTLHTLDREHGLITAEGPHYRFTQRLVQEKLYDELPPALRAAYHSALATTLESKLAPDAVPTPEYATGIARHHLLGERPAGAVPHARAAIDALVGRHEPRAVIEMAGRLRNLDAGLPPELRAHVAHVLGVALLSHGTPEEANEALREARSVSRELGDGTTALHALIALCDGMRAAGKFEEALVLAEEAVAEAAAHGDVHFITHAYDRLSLICRDLGRPEPAKEAASRGLEAASEAGDTATIGKLSTTLGSLEIELGNMEEAGLLLDRGVSIASLVGDHPVESSALNALAKIAFFEGRLSTALPILRRVLQIAYEQGNTRLEGVTATNMALVTPTTGDYEEAKLLAQRARDIGTTFGYPEIVAHAVMTIGQIQVDQGHYGDGLETFVEAQRIVAEMGTPTMEARLYLLMPNALAWVGRFDEASELFDQGLASARSSCTPREVFMIQWAAALMLDAQGRPDEALEAAAAANADLRATGMELMAVQNDQRLAEFHVRRGDFDAAKPLLEGALQTAERGGLRGLGVLCRAWLHMLPGGHALPAREELTKHAPDMTAIAHVRALAALAGCSGNEDVLADARAAAQRIVSSVPAEHRDAMREGVALYRALLT